VLQIILMIVLGGVEIFEGLDFGDDGAGVNLGNVELGEVGLGDAPLFVARVEDGRAVLRASVRPLAISLRGIMGDGEENHQQPAVGDFGSVVSDADGFGVAGDAHADTFVGTGFDEAAGVTGSDGLDALQVFEDSLDAPEAAAGENGGLPALGRSQRQIGCGGGKRRFGNLRQAGAQRTEGSPGDEADDDGESEPATNVRTFHG